MKEYLISKGWQFKVRSGQYIVKVCPFCGDVKNHFYIDPDKNVYFCHKCNAKGNEFQLKKYLGDVSDQIIHSFSEIQGVKRVYKTPPKDAAQKLHAQLLENNKAMDYLTKERCFTNETIQQFTLGYEEKGGVGWISIPYYKNGSLVCIKYRSLPPAAKTFRRTVDAESCLFNHDCIKDNEKMIITEGEFDAISLIQGGYKNVVSVPNGCSSFLPEWFDLLQGKQAIYLWYDNDVKGQHAARELAERLGIEKCYNIVRQEKDANEYFQLNEVFDLDNSYLFDIDNITPFFDAAGYLLSPQVKETTDITTPWHKINGLLGSIEQGDLLALSAVPKTGKTTWALNIAMHNAKKTIPVLFFCLEMRPHKLAKRVILAELMMNDKELNSENVKKIMNQYVSLPLYFGYYYKNINFEDVTNVIRLSVRRYGIKLLVFDNLHYLARSIQHQVQEVGVISRGFKLLAEELKIPIILISQPRKTQENKIMSYNDLKDSSSIGADSDQVIILYRKKTLSQLDSMAESSFDPLTLVRVDASRNSSGGDALMYFSGDKYCFTETVQK